MAIHGREAFIANLDQIFKAVDLCVENHLFNPTLILVLSIMDAFSWIEFPNINNPKDRFEKWVDKWVLPHEHVVCNAVDLYAYRSAMLHRFGTQSRLVENKQASAISFCRGGAPFKVLEKFRSIYMEDFGEDIGIVKFESLVEAVKKGVTNFLEHADSDTDLQVQMEAYFDSEQAYHFPSDQG